MSKTGTFQGAVTGNTCVDPRASDDSDEPRPDISGLTAGDTIRFQGEECRIPAVSRRMNYGQRGLYAFTLPYDVIGVTARLYVDRDPYMLDICNGGVQEIDPDDVEVLK